MNKFYLGMLIISFLYGCSTTSEKQSPKIEDPIVIPQTITPIKREYEPCSTTEVGKAAEEILEREGYLSNNDCRK